MAKHFALDIVSLAILSNHMHKQLRIRPDIVRKWSNREVARKWLFLYPKTKDKNGNACAPKDKEINQITSDKKRVKELRERLCSLSWFNRYLKEKIAKRANKEDQVTGHFFESRFKSIRIATEAAAIACSMYIDLNPVRAGIANTPEESKYTSVWYRIRARQAKQRNRKAQGKRANQSRATRMNDRHADAWLAPIHEGRLPADQRHAEHGRRISDDRGLPMSLDQYLELLDCNECQHQHN